MPLIKFQTLKSIARIKTLKELNPTKQTTPKCKQHIKYIHRLYNIQPITVCQTKERTKPRGDLSSPLLLLMIAPK